MEKYSSYKDSGVKWLGEIPSHWEMVRLKNCIIDSQSGIWGEDELHDGNDKICLRVADFNYDKGCIDEGNLTYRHYGNEFNSSKQLKQGDLLLEKSGGGDLFPVGRVVRFSIDDSKICTCSNFIQKLTIKSDVNSDFIYYLFKTMYYAKVNGLYFNQTTGIQNLKVKEYISQNIFIPTRTEQDAIVSYLDTVTSQIDVAIEQQKKMIELLNERKQIIINNAVTKGLDPNVKMKDSGVEWIGEIPEGWEVRKAKLCVTISNGSDPKLEGDIPVYGSGSSSFRTCGEYKEGPCVLIGRKGATLHIPHYIEGRYWNVDTAFDVKAKDGILLKFYYYLATCFDYQFYMSQTTLPSMTSFDYNRMKLPLPPINEQKEILENLEKKLCFFNNAISSIEKQITLLQERKQIIINEVVTGKVKV